jgi:cysteine desulfurase/selenocysteine lyase
MKPGDDLSGYLPPHELRALGGSLVDRENPSLPSSAASTPGLALAAASPAGVAPTLPADDPGTLAIALARIASEPLGGAGVAPQLAPISPSGLGSDPVAPQHAEAPRPAPRAETPVMPEVRVPFTPGGELVALPQLDMFALERVPLIASPGSAGARSTPGGSAEWIEEASAPDAPPVAPSTGGTFDPYVVRRDFPILEERLHGKRLVWLDNAATTQKPRAVIDRLSHYYEHENSNVHRAAHALAARATDAYESARETTRRFLNAPSASEIVFVRGATEGINLIAKSWGKRHVERGDEIVLTHLEHHANIVPWQQLCAEVGARLRVAPVDDRGDVILEEYEKLLCSKTRIVAFTQVSNALGTITPAKEMIEIAHRWGATVLLDGAQAVSHMPVDVQALDCDFYVFSGHKVFAPTGIGAVFGKRAVLDAMPPWQTGGNMIADVTFEKTLYQDPPWRFEAGTGNIADAAGMGAALDYVMRIGMPTIDRYEHELLVYATERLAEVPGLRMIGTSPNKAGVLSFVLAGQKTEEVGSALDKEGIAVRSGHHCAQPILRRFGLEATVRASLAFYNVREDIDALVAALKRLQGASV